MPRPGLPALPSGNGREREVLNDMPQRVLIGLGSNLGDRRANLVAAIASVAELPRTRVVKQSSFYESEPHGDAKTWFVNAVIELETDLSPDDLLKKLLAIEETMGRKRVAGKKWGARLIDLDLLLYNTITVDKKNLKLPHPELPNRRFVLAPLAELEPQMIHPTLGVSISSLLATVQDTKKIRLFFA